jgi:hypothetical protein
VPKVNPGDLITADFFNGLIDVLDAFDDRLTKLEGDMPDVPPGGAPVLESRNPKDDVRVGEQLSLIGRNFGPIAQARVKLGDVEISRFGPLSSDTLLMFGVPALPGLPKDTTVAVVTPQGTSRVLPIRVLAAQPVAIGNAFLDAHTPALGQIKVNTSYKLQWLVRSETSPPIPITYKLEALLSDVAPESVAEQWRVATTLNATEHDVSPTTPFTAVITTTLPQGAQRGRLRLKAESSDGRFSKVSDPVLLAVGSTPPENNPGIAPSLPKLQPEFDPLSEIPNTPNPVKAATRENGEQYVTVKAGAEGWITVDVVFKDPQLQRGDKVRFFGELEGSPAGWTTTGKSDLGTLTLGQPGGGTVVHYQVKNTAGDSAPNAAHFVAKAARRKRDDSGDEYVSFTTIPIENAG